MYEITVRYENLEPVVQAVECDSMAQALYAAYTAVMVTEVFASPISVEVREVEYVDVVEVIALCVA